MSKLQGWSLSALAALALSVASPATAATSLPALDVSPDITVNLGGQTVMHEDVAEDDLAGTVNLLDVGPVPGAADLDATHDGGGTDRLLSLDITTNLPGAGVTTRADVARWDGATYSLEFDAAANGVPAGARVDAVARAEDGDLLLSFDITVALAGGVVAHDEDLVRFDAGTGAFSLFFDGSAAGVGTALDLDGADRLSINGNLLLSFDTGGTVGGVTFADEDVLEYDPVGGTWELSYDGDAEHGAWAGANLDAISVMPFSDSDGDGVSDADDNCINEFNPNQDDADGDQYGDCCDCDFTGDGFCNVDDFLVFLPDFQSGFDSGSGTDMTSDGFVNVDDFIKFLPGFTSGLPGPSGTAP